ncbi:DEAD-box ATP-dependent RNA helicase [Thoreauomyces humboldtii]|nr:DEAD-box ATP-dependent RNA helicase [Thoreauomyces humboldtii]
MDDIPSGWGAAAAKESPDPGWEAISNNIPAGRGWGDAKQWAIEKKEMEALWAEQDAKKAKLNAKRAKERDPDFDLEEADPKKESAIFGKLSSMDQSIGMEAMSRVRVTVKGSNPPQPMETFEGEELFWLIKENLKLCHYEKPTPVQKYCIPVVTSGRDLMASAQTGSGKTAAFVVPVMNGMLMGGPCGVKPEIIDDRLTTVYPLVLILEPTRELAIQVHDETKKYGYRSWVRSRIVYGGVPIDKQVDHLKGRGVDLLIATPGRLQDLINRHFINLSEVRCLVLDEADKMLDMGFAPAIHQLMSTDMPTSAEGRQTLLFSATFPKSMETLARTFLHDPVRVMVGQVGSVANTIQQDFIVVYDVEKKESALLDILPTCLPGRILVFVDSKAVADKLETMINSNLPNLRAGAIHGGRDQWSREDALDKFKSGAISILVATSVAARGLDIQDVTQVINFDIPKDDDEYVHRIGRTGRIGREGKASSLYCPRRDDYAVARLIKKGTITPADLKALSRQNLEHLRTLVEGSPEALQHGGQGFSRGPKRGR